MLATQIPFYANLKCTPFAIPTSLTNQSLHFSKHSVKRCRFNLVIKAAGRDHYSTLNVSKNATLKDIKSSYRKLARQYHPDINRGPRAEEKFKEISAAYEMDPFEIYNAFFGDSDGFFGGSGEASGFNFNPRFMGKGLDIRYDLYLSFEESIFGGEHDIEVSRFETCNDCDGTGAKSSSCIRGVAMKTQRTPFGMMSQVSTCSKCSGNGKIITDHCRKCGGNGKVSSKRKFKVPIPPGISNGATMQFEGEGHFDKKRGIAGDLFITLHVKEKRGIRRDGLNLYSKISIDYTQAILGTVVKVETVDGLRDLQIPSGIQPGDAAKLSRMGVQDINKPFVRGDHHFMVNVVIPKDISDKERAIVKELASLASYPKVDEIDEIPTDSSGTFENKVDEYTTRDARMKSASSLWNSIRGFFRRNQSNERFTSVNIHTSGLLWKSRRPDLFLSCSLMSVFILTFILTIRRKIKGHMLLQRRNSHPHYLQNMKK